MIIAGHWRCLAQLSRPTAVPNPLCHPVFRPPHALPSTVAFASEVRRRQVARKKARKHVKKKQELEAKIAAGDMRPTRRRRFNDPSYEHGNSSAVNLVKKPGLVQKTIQALRKDAGVGSRFQAQALTTESMLEMMRSSGGGPQPPSPASRPSKQAAPRRQLSAAEQYARRVQELKRKEMEHEKNVVEKERVKAELKRLGDSDAAYERWRSPRSRPDRPEPGPGRTSPESRDASLPKPSEAGREPRRRISRRAAAASRVKTSRATATRDSHPPWAERREPRTMNPPPSESRRRSRKAESTRDRRSSEEETQESRRPAQSFPKLVARKSALSVYLSGVDAVKAALTTKRRKRYTLIVTRRDITAGLGRLHKELIKLAREQRVEVRREFDTVIERLAGTTKHDSVVLEASRYPMLPVAALGKTAPLEVTFAVTPAPQMREEAEINGTNPTVRHRSLSATRRLPPLVMLLWQPVSEKDTHAIRFLLDAARRIGPEAVCLVPRARQSVAHQQVQQALERHGPREESTRVFQVDEPGEFVRLSRDNGWRAVVVPVDYGRSEAAEAWGERAVAGARALREDGPCLLVLTARRRQVDEEVDDTRSMAALASLAAEDPSSGLAGAPAVETREVEAEQRVADGDVLFQ